MNNQTNMSAVAAPVRPAQNRQTALAASAVAQTPEGWTAEWHASNILQAEYPTAGAYVATRRRETLQRGDFVAGAANTLPIGGSSAAQTTEAWAAEWHASAALQAEYPTAGSYVATMKRQALTS